MREEVECLLVSSCWAPLRNSLCRVHREVEELHRRGQQTWRFAQHRFVTGDRGQHAAEFPRRRPRGVVLAPQRLAVLFRASALAPEVTVMTPRARIV